MAMADIRRGRPPRLPYLIDRNGQPQGDCPYTEGRPLMSQPPYVCPIHDVACVSAGGDKPRPCNAKNYDTAS